MYRCTHKSWSDVITKKNQRNLCFAEYPLVFSQYEIILKSQNHNNLVIDSICLSQTAIEWLNYKIYV